MLGLALLWSGCDRAPDEPESRSGRLVYGADDRVDHFEVAAPKRRARIAGSIAALIPKVSIRRNEGRVMIEAPSWGEVAGLCPGETFADQPAAAFCTGVLVDWDLVLTAGHCVRLFALADFAVVFGFHYDAPGVLSTETEALNPVAIVSEMLDPAGSNPRRDYAWLRLDGPAAAVRDPAPIHLGPQAIALGDPVISIGAGGGVPAKLDDGGKVRDPRAPSFDYFVADTDTSKGSSGGGAFDQNLALTGILVRGETDLAPTDAGCNAVVRLLDGADAGEQFTYAHRAAEGLCAQGSQPSSICRPDCGTPCQALPWPQDEGGAGGCSVAGGYRSPKDPVIVVLAVVPAVAVARRQKRATCQRR